MSPMQPLSPAYHALDQLVATHATKLGARDRTDRDCAAALGETARLICDEARECDPRRAERLVIGLRRSWPSLPAVRQLPPDETREALLATVISACISRFYSAAGNAASAAQSVRS